MHQTQRFVNSISVYLLREYVYQILILIGFMILLLSSNSAFALAPNPGATCQDITGASQGSLTNADYSSLISNTGNYVPIAGNAAGSIPLQMKISTAESSTNTAVDSLSVISASVNNSTVNAINVRRNFPLRSDSTTITLDFRNSITAQPIYLSNVAISGFDIDYSNTGTDSVFHDLIQIRGVTQSDSTIDGTYQAITGSNVRDIDGGLNIRTDFNCPQRDLGTLCQGSIQFSEAVTKVTIRYANNPEFITGNPTTQQVDFRVDNYCYVPQYIFSGTVFDDNGGIPQGSADKDNADITTPSSVYTNRPNYFNGRYDPTAPETGITDSTVRLANCSNTSTTYPTQSVIRGGAPVGEYQISIPKTTLATNTNLCLIESRTGNTYPIRTSNESRTVGFAATKYNYPDNNFGRVIAANAALVLRKAQYVNDCPTTLTYSDSKINTPNNTDPRAGFSESPINGTNGNALTPGQCIAYRITATNRSNLPINSFVMRDVLQKKGVDSALVTSVLANPIAPNSDFASNSVAIGQNNPVITNPLTLNSRTKRDFYFNTKYGTTSGNP